MKQEGNQHLTIEIMNNLLQRYLQRPQLHVFGIACDLSVLRNKPQVSNYFTT